MVTVLYSGESSPGGLTALWSLSPAQSRPPLLALAGTDFLLPCSCPEEEKSILIWQKNLSVVAQYDPEDDEQVVDGSFRNRTRLYYPAEKDNCSLLLRRASVKDEGNYSCYYKSERMKRIDVELLVAAQYTPQVESVPPESEGSTGPGVYRCQAAGGYPVGRLRWLLDDRPVNSTFTTRRSVRDHLYNLTSTVSVGVPEGAVLRCVVENPRLEGSVSAELTVRSSVTTDVTAVPTASERGGNWPAAEPWVALLGVTLVLSTLLAALLTVCFRRRCLRCRVRLRRPATDGGGGNCGPVQFDWHQVSGPSLRARSARGAACGRPLVRDPDPTPLFPSLLFFVFLSSAAPLPPINFLPVVQPWRHLVKKSAVPTSTAPTALCVLLQAPPIQRVGVLLDCSDPVRHA
ncbi:CD276 antigen-like isoform X2 [Scleropages formosus]|uniref:CD276 antigen-like isoform X2 n=1 Tax=Scleropages formosus TaxID=113540 RepID=UPI0010FAC6D5|nr:CD276 antigen-like isoform X2 [Scleropages formosus]